MLELRPDARDDDGPWNSDCLRMEARTQKGERL